MSEIDELTIVTDRIDRLRNDVSILRIQLTQKERALRDAKELRDGILETIRRRGVESVL